MLNMDIHEVTETDNINTHIERKSMSGKYLVTPKGEFQWAHIMSPDTTYKSEGQYHTKLRLKGEVGEKFKKSIDDSHGQWKKKCQEDNPKKKWQEYLPYKSVLDEEGMDAGIEFHFKLRASGTNSKTGETYTQRPTVVGPDKTPIPRDIKVANGSEGKVAYEIAPYEHGTSLGVQLRLRMVQILKLIEYTPNGSSADDVFDVEEGYKLEISEGNNSKEEGDAFDTEEENSGDF
tara:strand:+ start:1258 stop:1956 length:699 start_codon:yes stop_codon:yes gene_type:complete